MSIITICNHKGGCGKTTTALNLGSLLSKYEAYLNRESTPTKPAPRILIVDMDPQGGANYCLENNDPNIQIKKYLEDLLMIRPSGSVSPATSILPSAWAHIDYIPSTENGMANANAVFAAHHLDSAKVLNGLIKHVKQDYKYIIIDTGPAKSSFMWNALYAADMVIIPAIMEASNIKGATETINNIGYLRKVENKAPYFVGILPSVFRRFRKINDRPLTGSHEEYAEKIADAFRKYGVRVLHPIRESMDSQQAYGKKLSIRDYNPKAAVLSDYSALVEEIYNAQKTS